MMALMDEVAVLVCDRAENKAATSFDVFTWCYLFILSSFINVFLSYIEYVIIQQA